MTHANETAPNMKEYTDTMSNLQFSPEAKDRMAKRLAEAALKAQEQPAPVVTLTSRRKRRLPIAAAVAALALAMGIGGVAYAAGGLVNVPQFVQHLFGADNAKVEIVESIGRPVGIAQTVNGVTVSADAIIGDKTNVAVIFSISKDDGTPFEFDTLDDGLIPMGFSDDFDVSLPLFGGYGATGSSYFYDEDPSDNAIQLVETRSYESDGDSDLSLIGRMLTVHFSDLTYYGETESTVVAPGSWTLSFPLNYEDTSRSLETGQGFEVNGMPATIDQLDISPIALHMSYTVDQSVEWTTQESGRLSEEDSKLMDSLLGVEVSVTMKDGTTHDVMNSGGGRIGNEGDAASCETSIFWDRVLDLDEVASVTIGGTTIAL